MSEYIVPQHSRDAMVSVFSLLNSMSLIVDIYLMTDWIQRSLQAQEGLELDAS